MPSRSYIYVAFLALWFMPSFAMAAAGALDDKRPIRCDLDYLQMCEHGDHRCQWGNVVDGGGKQTLNIDLGARSIALLENGRQIDREPITSVARVKGNLYLHGTNPDARSSADGSGWMLRITTASGVLSVAVLADTSSFFIFGTCYNPQP